ncbi:FAD-binding oxidoreductase, partial [Sulfolobus sp. B5]
PTIFSSFYGYPKNLVLMAKIITGDGIIVKSGGKTAKFSSGYKLHKVISGSLGWLGIYLETTLKLYPSPETIVTIKTNNVELMSKYRPVSIIYERNERNEESSYVLFLGFNKVIRDIEKELGAKAEERLYRLNYEGDNVISIHVTRGKEIEEIKKVYNYVKVERANCILGTGYCRLIVKDFNHIDELRRNVNGYVVVERGEYSGDYWGFKSETMKKLKQALDPSNILSPNLF